MPPELIEEGKYSYLAAGAGRPLIVLHGLMGALSNFGGVVDYFSKEGFQVIIPQLPIYDLPLIKTNVKNIAKFVHGFMKFKGFEKASFMGNSLGGHVALVYALQHPDRVDQLILTGSSGLYEKAFGDTFPRREDKEYVRDKTQDVFYDPTIATDELVDDVFETINNRGKLIRILAIAKSAIRHNMAPDVPEIKSETCLIWGKQDSVTPPDVAKEFNRLLPNSDLYWIDKCGHAPMMEHPDEFNRILHAWFKEKAG